MLEIKILELYLHRFSLMTEEELEYRKKCMCTSYARSGNMGPQNMAVSEWHLTRAGRKALAIFLLRIPAPAFCYLAQSTAVCFLYPSRKKKKREREKEVKPSNTGRGINMGSEIFTDNQNLKFPLTCRLRRTPGYGARPDPCWGCSHCPWLSCSDSLFFHYLVHRTSWPRAWPYGKGQK